MPHATWPTHPHVTRAHDVAHTLSALCSLVGHTRTRVVRARVNPATRGKPTADYGLTQPT
eukprot:scaffold11877_cov101-Isochrysis_galbana.AAC.3